MINRFYLTEEEKKRISNLHETEKKRNFTLILEDVVDDFFTKQKSSFKKWPNGNIIDFKTTGTKGFEVKNSDGTSYVLIPDGRAFVNDGSGTYAQAQNYSWTKTPYQETPLRLEPKKATQIQSTLNPKDFKMSSGTSDETVGSSEDLKTQQTNIKSSSSKTKSEHFEKCKTWYNDYKKTKKIRDNRKTLESIASKAQENINKYLKLFDKPIKLENGETVTCRALVRIVD
jgi:hypothetical protein